MSDVPDAIDAMNVVPDGFAQSGGVHIRMHGHGVIRERTHYLKLLIQKLCHLAVQPVHQGKPVILPRIVLKTRNHLDLYYQLYKRSL